MSFQSPHEIGREKGVNARCRLFRDEVAEPRQRHAGGAALIDNGGDAGAHADHVRVEAEAAGDVAVDVGVGVDHAGQHELAADIHHFGGRGGEDGLGHRGDAPVAHRDVADAVDAGSRADHAATAQEKVVPRGFDHRAPRARRRGAKAK